MAEYDDVWDSGPALEDYSEMGPHTPGAPATPGNQGQYLMDDFTTPQPPKQKPAESDVSLPTVEVLDSQEASQLLSQEVSTPPQLSRPSFFNPANTVNTAATSRPSFFNPSTAHFRVSLPRSIFGPPKVQGGEDIKAEDAEDNQEDMYAPGPPYKEPVQPETTIPTPIRTSQFASTPVTPITPNKKLPLTPRNAPVKKVAIRKPSIDNDSDDDICVIEPADASLAAKTRWAEPRTFIEIEDDEPSIKPEPGTENERTFRLPNHFFTKRPPPSVPPKMHDITAVLAKQRALLNKKKGGPKNSSHIMNGNRRPAELESPSRIHSIAKKRRLSGQNVPEDPEQVDAAMRAGSQEDDSWMHDEPSGDDDEERHQMQIKVDTLSRREKNSKISEGEILELARLRKQLILKEKLLRCARGSPSRQPVENSLFVPADRDEILQRHRAEQKQRASRNEHTPGSDSEEGDGDDTGDQGEREGSDEAFGRMLAAELDGDGLDGVPSEKELSKPSKKPRRKVGKTAREVYAADQEKLREKARAKTQKQKAKGGKGGGHKGAAKGKGATKKGKAAAKGKGGAGPGRVSQQLTSRSFAQRSGIDEIGVMILNGLMNSDPITERLQNPIFDVGPEPEMAGAHTKGTQLQRLLANIPEGSSVKDAKTDRTNLQQASRSFGYAKVKAMDGKWLIKGMKSTLYHHQLLGAQWMIQRELSDEAPYGGLLADGMGLGKTVQTLACMVGNPPGEADRSRGVKATLIVVPSSVIEQWLDEIRNHAEITCFPKIMRYKASSKIPLEVLRDLDIVVCSYQEVMRQFPFPDQKDRELIAKIGYKKWWKKACKSMGDLFGVYWYRVVLDEAHAIKNNSARTSLACQNLRSVFRWCLTGTPLLNRLEELFPYLRFLKANYSMDWKTFQRYFCDPDANDCHTRIATLLSYTMMRRTMKTTILNRAIITLPPPHPEIRYVQFSAQERIIYRITENRFRTNLNNYFAAGTASKAYAIFLVQLLRLRQCTSHPFMLERTIRESWTFPDVQELRTRLNALGKSNIPFYEQCQVWVSNNAEERQAALARGEAAPDAEAMPYGLGDYGRNFEMGKALKTLSEEDLYSRVTCSLCSDLPRHPMLTDCNHIFCKECLTTYMHRAAAQGENDDYMTCPACEKIFASFKAYKGPQANDEDSMDGESPDLAEINPGSGNGKRKKYGSRHGSTSKGVDHLGFEPKVTDSTWVKKSDSAEFPLAPSAKTAALKAILLKGFMAAPMDKVVIYVQFRLLAQIVGRICESEKWGFVYLTGDSSLEHRSKVVKEFRDNRDVKIMIAGLKCGGLGLNFPWANRCISLDLWWNHAVEQQAFGRIFRIGQKKNTYMTRIIVKNSVDMRLLTMQMHKLKACDTAMESGEEKQKPSLSLRELAQLFGFLRTDADGEIVAIEPDYEDDD